MVQKLSIILFLGTMISSSYTLTMNKKQLRQQKLNQKLLEKIKSNKIKQVKKLIKLGADINTTNQNGNTPLIFAKSKEMIKLLLSFNANIEKTNDGGFTPLHHAVYAKSLNKVELLLLHNAQVNTSESSGHTPLHWAALHGNVEIAQLLLNHNANPSINDDRGADAVDMAILGDQAEILRLFLDKINLNSVKYGQTYLDCALSRGSKKVIQLLTEAGAKKTKLINTIY